MALEDRRLLATFTVNSTADTLTAGVPTQGTLRWAIDQANATAGDNTIQFDASAFSTPQTILLTQGQLELSQAGTTETVTGPSTGVAVNGGRTSRVFQVDSGVTAVLSGLTITGGTAGAFGGGLLNDGTAELTDCTILGNTAPRGGGIENDTAANLTLTDLDRLHPQRQHRRRRPGGRRLGDPDRHDRRREHHHRFARRHRRLDGRLGRRYPRRALSSTSQPIPAGTAGPTSPPAGTD
jgi:hypothetical protein